MQRLIPDKRHLALRLRTVLRLIILGRASLWMKIGPTTEGQHPISSAGGVKNQNPFCQSCVKRDIYRWSAAWEIFSGNNAISHLPPTYRTTSGGPCFLGERERNTTFPYILNASQGTCGVCHSIVCYQHQDGDGGVTKSFLIKMISINHYDWPELLEW